MVILSIMITMGKNVSIQLIIRPTIIKLRINGNITEKNLPQADTNGSSIFTAISKRTLSY